MRASVLEKSVEKKVSAGLAKGKELLYSSHPCRRRGDEKAL